MELNPAQLAPIERYKILIGSIIPRPIAFVSTCDAAGRFNIAPFSFFAGVGSNPMTLLFCPANTPEGHEKDTLRNCKPAAEGGTGVFVVNTVSEAFMHKMAAAAEPLAYGESEFAMTGLTPVSGHAVAAPRLAEAAISFECRTLQVIRTNPGQPAGGNVVLGEVVYIHARDGVINDRMHVDPAALAAIGRLGGTGYCTTRERFELPMGRPALGTDPTAILNGLK